MTQAVAQPTQEAQGGGDVEARRIIGLRNREASRQQNFRTLWQDTADLIFPRENQIVREDLAGSRKALEVYDATAIRDSQDMASGLSGALVPTGGPFFGLTIKDRTLAETDRVQRYLHEATEISHQELFDSNFMLQLNETLRSLIVFGTGNLYSEWDGKGRGLNFKDYDIATYQMLEDARGRVDTVILTIHMTARQAEEEFGPAALSDEMLKDLEGAEGGGSQKGKTYEFVHLVEPRKGRDTTKEDVANMPWASVFVDVKARQVVKRSGFREFPFAVARWMKSSSEKYGRGQGTEVLPDVRVLQNVKRSLVECGHKWNEPPLEVLDTFEGRVDLSPGALNYVRQLQSVRAVDAGARGNFPITVEILNEQRDIVHQAFFRDIFRQLADLRGDRRTTVEIRARLREGLRRLAGPAARIHSELLSPVLTRCVRLLIRNGRIPYPPEEVAGKEFNIEYVGELALALQEQQAEGFLRWANFLASAREVFPGIADNAQPDRAARRLARKWGVPVEDMATEDEVQAVRKARQEALEAKQAAEEAGEAAKGYKQTKEAPEEGSPAAAVMDAIGG